MSAPTKVISILWLLLPAGLSAASAAVDDAGAIPKLLQKYCFDCHGDGFRKGDFSLEDLLAQPPGTADRRSWEKAWKNLRQEFMPPADTAHPSPAERRSITQWIEQQALGVDYQRLDPGRVTIRRLNRIEYEYSVMDLFGADFGATQLFASDMNRNAEDARLRDKLPPDDTAFGFDNNGDFMTLSPALLEKFFNIAEWVVDRAIVQDGPRHPVLDLAKLGLKKTIESEKRNVEQAGVFTLHHAGRHRLDLQFSAGDFAEVAGTFELKILVDNQEVQRDLVEVGGHRVYRYSADVTLTEGEHTWAFLTRPANTEASGKAANRGKALNPYLHARLTGPIGTGVYEYPASHQRVFFRGRAPVEEGARRAYAKEIVQRVADRAFRRPAEPAQIERLTALVMRNENFERGVGQALIAILASPKFLFRSELQPQPDDPKSIHAIDDFALASRLSYLLWLSLPDDELRQLAAAGQLRANLEPQLRRMLSDPKAARFFEDFPGQWLRTRNVLMTANSREGAILDRLRAPMKRETELLFEDIARHDRDLLELVTADYTFVDRKLAEFYGLKAELPDEEFHRVALPRESHRGGILTQGSFLVSTSNPNRTSPVKRGLYVLESLWATEPPAPPANIPPLDDAKVGGALPKTVREQLAVHRENKACAACHAHFDPIGLVLENYDLIGRWREQEAGQPIVPRETTVTGETLAGMDDLRALFAARPDKFYRGITTKLLTYAIGRGLEPFDAVTVDRITDELVANRGTFSTLLLGVVQSAAFQMRRGDDGAAKEAPRIAMPTRPTDEQLAEKRRRKRPTNAANANAAAEIERDAAVDKPGTADAPTSRAPSAGAASPSPSTKPNQPPP